MPRATITKENLTAEQVASQYGISVDEFVKLNPFAIGPFKVGSEIMLPEEGTEAVRTSDEARDKTEENLAKLGQRPEGTTTLYRGTSAAYVPMSYVGQWISQGWGTQKPITEKKSTNGLSSEEESALGIERAGEKTELESEVSSVEDTISAYEAQLANLTSSIDETTSATIKSIQNKMNIRRTATTDSYKRLSAAYEQAGIRGGSRYTPEVWAGVITEVENQGIQKLVAIDAEEQDLIAQASEAGRNKKWEELNTLMGKAEDKRKEKAKELSDLNKVVAEENNKQLEKQKATNARVAILGLYGKGVQDPFEIYDTLTEAGMTIDWDDIDKTFSLIKGSKESVKTQVVSVMKDGVAKNVLINSDTGEEIKDLGETKAGAERTQMITTGEGKRLLINSDTGETIKDYGMSESVLNAQKQLGGVLSKEDTARLDQAGVPYDIYSNITKLILGGISNEEIKKTLQEAGEDTSYLDDYDRVIGTDNIRNPSGGKLKFILNAEDIKDFLKEE